MTDDERPWFRTVQVKATWKDARDGAPNRTTLIHEEMLGCDLDDQVSRVLQLLEESGVTEEMDDFHVQIDVSIAQDAAAA